MALTLAIIWHDYLEEHCKLEAIDPRRVMIAVKHVNDFFTPQFKVKKLERAHSRDYIRHRRAEGAADGTIRRELAMLRAALSHAFKENRLKQVPCIDLPPCPPPRERYLELDEVKAIFAQPMPNLRTEIYLWIQLCSWARATAIEELTVGRVDLFDRRVMDFRVPGRKVTKKRRGEVPISDELWPVLFEQIYRYGPPWRGDRVVPPHKGHFGCTYRWCKKVERAAGINERGVCRHVFRKTGPSHAAQNGVSLEFIAEVLHDTQATTHRHYAKYKPERLRAVVERGWLTPVAPPSDQPPP